MSNEKKKHTDYNPNGDSSSAVAAVSYDIEKIRVEGLANGENEIQIELKITKFLYTQVGANGFPPKLQYVDSYYDKASGTSGSAFLDTNTGQIVLGYAGTNVGADGIKDILTDATLIYGSTIHASAALNFYDSISGLGYPIELTGHSLGGNIAVLVALITNNPSAITYNGAPLNVQGVLDFLGISGPFDQNNSAFLNELIANYSGDIIRFVSEKDPLNGVANFADGLYFGQEYVIYNNKGHSMKDFLREDVSSYMQTILDLEQRKQTNKNIGVDLDGDGVNDVVRRTRQLVTKNLLGIPGDNSGNGGQQLAIDPSTLINLSVNLRVMAGDDVVWIDNNVTQCDNKNVTIESSFETRRLKLNDSVVEGLEGSGLGTVLTGVDDSFGKINEKKDVLETLGSFREYDITRKFDAFGSSGNRKWFKEGVEWKNEDVKTFKKELKELKKTSNILLHNVETDGQFTFTSPATGGTEIYTYATLTDITESIVKITNGLEPKIKKAFKGIGLRSGKNDGIAQSLTEVFEVEHQNTGQLTSALANMSELAAAVAQNFSERDEWLKNAIESGNMLGAPNAISIPSNYQAFLDESEIFDDVKDVLQAFDKQVESSSRKLAKQISSAYMDILNKLQEKTQVVSDGINEFKSKITDMSTQLEHEIKYEKKVSTIVDNPDYSKDDINYTRPTISPTMTQTITETVNLGPLSNSFPADVSEAIAEAERSILPLLDIFNSVLTATQTFSNGINTMDSYLEGIIETAVYKAFELNDIITVQLLSSEVVNRMISELTNLSSALRSDNRGQAIQNLASQVDSGAKLLGYFNNLIQDCFGDQGGGGRSTINSESVPEMPKIPKVPSPRENSYGTALA